MTEIQQDNSALAEALQYPLRAGLTVRLIFSNGFVYTDEDIISVDAVGTTLLRITWRNRITWRGSSGEQIIYRSMNDLESAVIENTKSRKHSIPSSTTAEEKSLSCSCPHCVQMRENRVETQQ